MARVLIFICVALTLTACKKSSIKQEENLTSSIREIGQSKISPQPAMFSGGLKRYCDLRIKFVSEATKKRNNGVPYEEFKQAILQDNQIPPSESLIASNAAYLSYKQPELSQSTLAAVESLRCAKFTSTKKDISDKKTVSLYPLFLECQSNSPTPKELYPCLIEIIFPGSKIRQNR